MDLRRCLDAREMLESTKGLTLSADFYHIDLRNVIIDRDANIILGINFDT